MARQLWLLRHADAEPHGTRPDPERRLTERGERQSRLAGLALGRMSVEFAGILSSPKERALRTAALALDACDGEQRQAPLAVHAPLEGGFNGEQALAALDGLGADGRLLLVGHEPDFSNVVAELTGAHIDLKKGGLAVVRVGSGSAEEDEPSEAAAGELVLLLRPVELALIANAAGAEL